MGLGEKVAKFQVCLSQQVQILQSEYAGGIWPKHVEEMKHDHFYEGLIPKHWCMLAHKADGENPTDYSNLFLAIKNWKEEQMPGAVCSKRQL